MSPQNLRLGVKPGAGDVTFTRFVGAKDTPQITESNRGTTGLSTRYEGDVQTWVDPINKTRTVVGVMFQPIDHGMKCVISPLTLELCLLVVQVVTPNSVKTRGSVANADELGLCMIMLVTRESINVLSKDECFYFFVWILKEARLYFFNASSRHQYVLTHKDSEQLALM